MPFTPLSELQNQPPVSPVSGTATANSSVDSSGSSPAPVSHFTPLSELNGGMDQGTPDSPQPVQPKSVLQQAQDKTQATGGVMKFLSDLGGVAKNTWQNIKQAGQAPNQGSAMVRTEGAYGQGLNETLDTTAKDIPPIGETLKTVGGAISGEANNMKNVLSFLTPGPIKDGLTHLASGAMDKYNAWREANPEHAKNLDALGNTLSGAGNVAGLLVGGGEAGPVAKTAIEGADVVASPAIEKAGQVLADTGQAVKQGTATAVSSVTRPVISMAQDAASPIEENVKNALQDPNRSSDISQVLAENFKQAQLAKSKTGAMTPFEIAGKEQLGGALEDLQAKMSIAGKEKEAALAKNGSQRFDLSQIESMKDLFHSLLKDRLGIQIEPNGNLSNAPGRMSLLTDDVHSTGILADVNKALEALSVGKMAGGSATLQKVNDVVDLIDSKLYASKVVGAVPINSRLEGILKQVMGELNTKAKELGGPEYMRANEDYSRLIDLRDRLNSKLGNDMKNAAPIFKQVFSPAGGVRELLAELERETGRPIFERATLAKFAMDAVGDPRAKSLLTELSGLPTTAKGIPGKILEFISNKLASPEAIESKAQRMIKNAPPRS